MAPTFGKVRRVEIFEIVNDDAFWATAVTDEAGTHLPFTV